MWDLPAATVSPCSSAGAQMNPTEPKFPLSPPCPHPLTHQACLDLALQGFGKGFAPVAAQHQLLPSNFRLSEGSIISTKVPGAESRQGQCEGHRLLSSDRTEIILKTY